MKKYENMVERNLAKSKEKTDKAIKEMIKMLDADEQVTVCALAKRTECSRSFFYNNQKVHEELQRIRHLQEGRDFARPQKAILDKAMDKELVILKKRLCDKDIEIEKLKTENEKLKKAATSKILTTIKYL